MDSPISAVSVYKNKSYNIKKDKKKRKNKSSAVIKSPGLSSKPIKEKQLKKMAEKMKRQQKAKNKSKNIAKNKTPKKKVTIDKRRPSVVEQLAGNGEASDNEVPLLEEPHTPEEPQTPVELDDSHSNTGSIDFVPVTTDSSEEGLKVFQWMIAPIETDDFFKNVWEKRPLHISRNKPTYYKDILTTAVIDDMLRNESIQYTKNIDITSYENEIRNTHNPEGRALPYQVWDFYLHGCSIRLLNPQTYIPRIHLLNATLQEYFNSFVGANAYLTPPDAQGFAPHYDDIEAFILQTEGKKHWKVYNPLDESSALPRVSSRNFDQSELGEPLLEVTLEAGDILYFPRGFIHQAQTVDGEHSLHVTISMYQKHSWADLFEKMLPGALQMAVFENIELRRGLPLDIYTHFGLVFSDSNTPRRKKIESTIKMLFDKIKVYLSIDDAVDQMSLNLQHDALPPVLNDTEKAVTVYGDSDVMIEGGKIINRVEISLDTRIRLLRKNILRIVSEEKIRLYYYVENSLEYHGSDLSYLELEEEFAPGIETLISTYPEYVSVENLDIAEDSNKLHLADTLWGKGLIMTEYPLENVDSD